MKNVFESLMGTASWNRLNGSIRERLMKEMFSEKRVHFRGRIEIVETSRMGRFMAYFGYFTGGLCPYTGNNVECDVYAYHLPGTNDMFKKRLYHFPGKTWEFESRGHFTEKTGEMKLLEYCKAGFGMVLEMKEIDGNIEFLGRQYFWDTPIGFLKMPSLFTPGVLHLSHKHKSETEFYYEMKMIHSIWGLTFYQKGWFKEVQEEQEDNKDL
eukprot:TRINITY_DN6737_c0_g1_i1.p1 TRINITY_DN6737_c0_g1~~TRINITY_DN6737_c0_g1_i1.p1  ORF type:complete len:211 (-),score=61.15 TRINITY_DN6737_c0_g1_i1:8-640(-)